ncbi:MAG: alpha/beta hydrolase [Clostridia bacterium]|nr:alpha/beta hydrolase [Clostridia bacterium]
MRTVENICYSGDQLLDLHLPDKSDFDLFIYFHGGGLEKGDKTALATQLLAPFLTGRGIAVASCNYRMYPCAQYPDFLNDAAAAVHWLSNHINEYGTCRRMIVGGSSAGGYLSMMLCFDKRWYEACGQFPVPVVGYFHDAGQPTCHFNVLRERGVDRRRLIVDDSAPLFYIGTEASYPPMMLVVSDDDMKNRYEQTLLVLSTLRHFAYDESKIGFTLMHGKHCAYCKQVDEKGDSVLGKMVLEFIQSL